MDDRYLDKLVEAFSNLEKKDIIVKKVLIPISFYKKIENKKWFLKYELWGAEIKKSNAKQIISIGYCGEKEIRVKTPIKLKPLPDSIESIRILNSFENSLISKKEIVENYEKINKKDIKNKISRILKPYINKINNKETMNNIKKDLLVFLENNYSTPSVNK
jgi:hypothetical protein